MRRSAASAERAGAPRAGRAQADELGGVLDLGEDMAVGHIPRPVVEAAVADLLDPPARATGQVVVMATSAQQKRLLPGVAPNRVRLALVSEALQVAVDGREAHSVEPFVKL